MKPNTSSSNPTITVTLFGTFTLSNSQGTLDTAQITSKKITQLLAYLLIYHQRELNTLELSEMLWDDEECKNPAGALKNLIYRTRNLLRTYLGNYNFILTAHSGYHWNPDIHLLIDAQLFEDSMKKSRTLENPNTLKHCLEDAISLYHGNLLNSFIGEHWVITLSTYYHSLFLKGTRKLAELYESEQKYDDMEFLVKRCLTYDSLDETLHYLLIKSYVGQNKISLALEHYELALKQLQSTLGISSPTLLNRIHSQLMSVHKVSQITLEEVAYELEEKSPKGAFFCDCGVFKEVYRLEARRVKRLGIQEFFLLFTIQAGVHPLTAVEAQYRCMKKATTDLEHIIQEELRIGDVLSKLSEFQVGVLLPACSYEDAIIISERISGKFYDKYHFQRIAIAYHMDELSIRASCL